MDRIAALLFLYISWFIVLPGESSDSTIVFDHDTLLRSGIEIGQEVVCIIKPGVTLRFKGYYGIVVRGILICNAEEKKPIVITGMVDVTEKKDQPCWQGIEIIGRKADAVFRYCRIEKAYRNYIVNANPSFYYCEFFGNHYALYCSGKASPNIKNCHISDNSYGIVAEAAAPLLLDNVISDNKIGVYTLLGSRLIAGRNTISGNKVDISSDESLGKNQNTVTVKYIWDMMNQLY